MEELLSKPLHPREEIIFLLTTAILRKQQRAQHKERVRLDNSSTSCMTVNTTEKTAEDDYDG